MSILSFRSVLASRHLVPFATTKSLYRSFAPSSAAFFSSSMPAVTLPRRSSARQTATAASPAASAASAVSGVTGPMASTSTSPLAAAAAPPRPSRKKSTSTITHAVSDHIAADAAAASADGTTAPQSNGVDENQAPSAPKAKRARKSKAAAAPAPDGNGTDAAGPLGDATNDTPAPAKRGAKRKAASKATAAIKEVDQDDAADASADVTAESVEQDGEPELDSDGEPVRRAKNGRKLPKKKAKKPKVYVIPDVPKRDFRQEYRPDSTDDFSSQAARSQGFVGRIGYACLNTVLRTADPPVFSSRTARIKSIDEKGLDWVKELALQNCRDIIPMLQWNAEHNIRFMRLSSEIFPFASHKVYGYDLDFAKEELAEAGRVARSLGHRVTAHPGQFCQLGSPNPEVVTASIRELEVHCAVFDLMGMDQDSVMIIHGGGVYQDRPATLERMRDTIRNKLPQNVRNRLVLENDEISWSAEQLLPICHEFDIPMVFDFHHDMLRPSVKSPRELMPELLALFKKRNIRPKFHLSHPRPGSRNLRERRAHSDRCTSLPLDLPPNADIMIEAKDKEQAVLELYRIYDLFPVEHSILRPPADDITSATSGRRKTLNGSGGARDQDTQSEGEDDGAQDEDGKKGKSPRKPTEKQLEAEKVKRSIEHAKKIAAKRGLTYKGPEWIDPGSNARRLEQGPILSTQETLVVMEEEARQIREELKLRPRGERSVSEIRDAIEGKIRPNGEVKSEAEGESGAQNGSQESRVPKSEIMQDMSEHKVPGEEEKVVYQPTTPKKENGENGSHPVKGGVIIPTSAENVERVL